MSIRITPLLACPALEAHVPGRVYLKLECLQNTGSFKLRGATRAIAMLSDSARSDGVVTASAGNHGAGLAFAAASHGIPVTVVVPERTPKIKKERMRQLGVNLLVDGADYDASEAVARRLAKKRGCTFVSAFDDNEVIAGNGGSLGLEIFEQNPNVTKVVVPVGGGGLIAGMAAELVPRGVTVVGAQPANNCAMRDSLDLGVAQCVYQKQSTVAEGCEGAVCERTFATVARHKLAIGLASEDAILRSVAFLYRECGVISEASGAVPIAALLENTISVAADDVVVVVISGGNIDPSLLDTILCKYPESESWASVP